MDATVAAFVLEHFPASQMWEDGALDNWLAWAAGNDYLFRAYDSPDSKRLVGLVIAKPMSCELVKGVTNRPDDKHDPQGPIIYVELAISTGGKPVLQALLRGIMDTFADKPLIAFFRFGRNQAPKVYSFTQFCSILLRN